MGRILVRTDGPERHAILPEVIEIFRLAGPICSSSLLNAMFQFSVLVFAGQLGTLELAAASLANSYFNIVYYMIQGALTAMDTRVAQAFGRGHLSECKAWLRRSLAINGAMCIPVCGVLYGSERVFIALDYPIDLTVPAVGFLHGLIPGIPFLIVSIILQKYQQGMNILKPSLVATVVTNIVAIIGYYSVVEMGGGLQHLAWVSSASRLLLCVLMGCSVLFSSSKDGEVHVRELEESTVWNSETIWSFITLALAGSVMMGVEALAFEVTVWVAALEGQVALDAHNILVRTTSLAYQSAPMGLSAAAAIRVGNLLGADNANSARTAALSCVVLSAACMGFAGICVFLFRLEIGELFTEDPRVLHLVAYLAPVAALCPVFDGIQGSCSGCLRAMGKQAANAVCMLGAFYAIALPLGYWICICHGSGIIGLWYGLNLGLGLVSIFFCARAFFFVDWRAEARSASKKELHAALLG